MWLEEKENKSLPCKEFNPVHPAHSPSLYSLSYPDSSDK
jgi:hypothetical protein